MFAECRTNTHTIRGKCQPDLEWSLQPVFLWMQILGIPSGRFHLSSILRRAIVLMVGVIMVIWRVLSSISFFLVNINRMIKDGGNEPGFQSSKTEKCMEVINEILLLFSDVSMNLSFVAVSHWQWKSLWKKACKIEEAMKLDETFFRSLRKIAWAAIVVLILETAGLIYRTATNEFQDLTIKGIILHTGFWITQLYPITAVIVFMCLVCVASMMLERLVHELPAINSITCHSELMWKVIKWKRNYQLIHDYVDKINDFFGFILLAFTIYQLFRLIFYLFWLYLEFQNQRVLSYQYTLIIYILRIVIYVSLLVSISQRITEKVMECSRNLRKLQFTSNTIQSQINFLILDLNIDTPKLTAMDIFEIGPNFLLTFFGVTITYFMTLDEFETQN